MARVSRWHASDMLPGTRCWSAGHFSAVSHRCSRQSAAWQRIYERVKKRAGGKKAIVAVARRLLCVMYAMLRDGTNYDLLKVGEPQGG